MKPVTGNFTGYRLTGNRLTTLPGTVGFLPFQSGAVFLRRGDGRRAGRRPDAVRGAAGPHSRPSATAAGHTAGPAPAANLSQVWGSAN